MSQVYDVVIVGAGPAGLSAAIYAGTRGPRAAIIETGYSGGRAATSPCIRNYPGFPAGITGRELARQLEEQAQEFGAAFIDGYAVSLEGSVQARSVTLADGRRVVGKTILLATGLVPRQLKIPSVNRLLGKGVSYTPPPVDVVYPNEVVAVLGNGNAAGQTAVHLALKAGCRRVHVIVTEAQLRMAPYLRDELLNLSHVHIHYESSVVAAGFDNTLSEIMVRKDDRAEPMLVHRFFAILGGEPSGTVHTGLALDARGYVITGAEVTTRHEGFALDYESSKPGIFVAGDIRIGARGTVLNAMDAGQGAVENIRTLLSTHK